MTQQRGCWPQAAEKNKGEEQVKRESPKHKCQGRSRNDPGKSFLGFYFCLLRFAIGLLTCSSVLLPGAQHDSIHAQRASDFTPWTFREDFRHGIPGWMSFPLSQDVGYDPTIYTKEEGGAAVLVRDVISYGARLLRVGVVRPLRFHVSPSSSFRLVYDFETCGKIIGIHLALGAMDGRRYNHSLSFEPGVQRVQVGGRQLEVPVTGVEVEAIVLEAEVAAPPAGCHSRLALRALEIQAERTESLTIRVPELDRSPIDDVAVAREVVSAGSPLKVELGSGSAARLAVYDDVGGLVRAENIPAGATRETQVVAPGKPGLYKAEITSPLAKSEFNFFVLGKVPAHPRVLLTRERLEQLHSQSYSNELLAIVHRRASELRNSIAYNPKAGQNIELLPTVSVHPGIPEYFSLMENYSNSIAVNALDFRMNGDRQALEAARQGLLTVAAWSTWTPAWFIAKGLHNYYEVGVFTQRVALGYDLIADELSQEEKSKIAEAFWEKSIRPTLDGYFLYDRLPIAASNHEAQMVGGSIEACAALYGDAADWGSRFGPALAELVVVYERLLEGLFPGDGSEAEPAGYENFAMEGMSWGMSALHDLDIRPRGFERMMGAFWWLGYAQVRPDLLLDTGDFGSELRALSGYAWGAEYAGDPALRAFYETATDQSLTSVFGLPHTGQTLERAPGLLDLVCCTHPSGVAPQPPLSRIFPARGSAVLRSGWRPEDTVISLRVGPWFNHEHHDQGSFRVAAYGEEVVAEAGPADYYKDPHYPDYFTQAPAHNTVVIDDDAFSQEDYDGRYWASFQKFAKFERHVFSAGIDYLAANLAPAYGDASQINRLAREYLFLKPDVLIVHDRIESATPHAYSWFLHIPPEADASIDAARALIRRKAAFAALTAAGENTHWTLEPQPVPTIAYRDFDRIPVEPREAFRLDSPREKEGSFLVALHFQKAGEEAAPLQPLPTTSGQGFRAAGGTAEAIFRSKPGQLTTADLTADADVLAIKHGNGVEEILSGNLKVLQRGRLVLFTSSPATDVALRESPTALEVQIFCSAMTDLKIHAEKPAREVRLDQGLVTPRQAGGFISFERLAKGEHVVSISY
jgi:hypothetical protein